MPNLGQSQVEQENKDSSGAAAAAGGKMQLQEAGIRISSSSLSSMKSSGPIFGQLKGTSSSAIAKKWTQGSADLGVSIPVEDGFWRKMSELMETVKALTERQQAQEVALQEKDSKITKVAEEAAAAREALSQQVAQDQKKTAELLRAEREAAIKKVAEEAAAREELAQKAAEAQAQDILISIKSEIDTKLQAEEGKIAKVTEEAAAAREKLENKISADIIGVHMTMSLEVDQKLQLARAEIAEETKEATQISLVLQDQQKQEILSSVSSQLKAIDAKNQNNTVENFLMLMNELDDVVADAQASVRENFDDHARKELRADLEQETLIKALRLACDKGANEAMDSVFCLIKETNPTCQFSTPPEFLQSLENDSTTPLLGSSDQTPSASDSEQG